MQIYIKNYNLFINDLKFNKDLRIDDINILSRDTFEVWDYGNMFSRRLICDVTGNEKCIFVVNFNKNNGKILFWSITPYNLIYKKKELDSWARKKFDLNLPVLKNEEGFKILNQKNIHEGYYDISCIFIDEFNNL